VFSGEVAIVLARGQNVAPRRLAGAREQGSIHDWIDLCDDSVKKRDHET
jgi:hypothetical protein